MVYYYVAKEGSDTGSNTGPYSLEDMQGLIASGQVQLTDFCWEDQLQQWRVIGEMPELAPLTHSLALLQSKENTVSTTEVLTARRTRSHLTCPHCDSENIQRFRVLFEGGTHQTQGTSTSVVYMGGRTGVAHGSVNTTTMSLIAQEAAPPVRKVLHVYMWVWSFFFCPLIFVAPFIHYYERKWNLTKFPSLYSRWERSWKCLSCGYSFVS